MWADTAQDNKSSAFAGTCDFDPIRVTMVVCIVEMSVLIMFLIGHGFLDVSTRP